MLKKQQDIIVAAIKKATHITQVCSGFFNINSFINSIVTSPSTSNLFLPLSHNESSLSML